MIPARDILQMRLFVFSMRFRSFRPKRDEAFVRMPQFVGNSKRCGFYALHSAVRIVCFVVPHHGGDLLLLSDMEAGDYFYRWVFGTFRLYGTLLRMGIGIVLIFASFRIYRKEPSLWGLWLSTEWNGCFAYAGAES